MKAEIIFSILNTLVLPIWFLMIAMPRWRLTQILVYSYVVPVVLGLAYVAILIFNPGSLAEADFSSLQGIKTLFQNGDDWMISAGWFHYLAFDLLVGAWILRDSQEQSIPHFVVIPSIIFTFILGPTGLVLYYITRPIFGQKI